MNEHSEKTYRLEDESNSYNFEKHAPGFDQGYKPEPTLKNTSYYATEKDGCLYHYCGKTRIKVSEHFSDHGKSVSELIENVILHTAKKTA